VVNPDQLSRVTLAKVEKAETKYHSRGYNRTYEEVYKACFRERLITNPDKDSVLRLTKFVNSWSNRTRYSTLPHLEAALSSHTKTNDQLRDVRLEGESLDSGSLAAVQSVFQELSSVKHFGPTGASKFLGVIQPQLCVMWDVPIRKVYRYSEKAPDYADYLVKMRKLALRVLADAGRRDIADPAAHISRNVGFEVPFTLATLINHYVWVNVTMPLQKRNIPISTRHEQVK